MTGKRQEREAAFAASAFGTALGDFLCALAFLTRLPIPAGSAAHARPLAGTGWAFPLVGLAVGLIAGAALALGHALGLPALAAALLALGVGAVVTGALHEDGFTDTLDGFWGAADRAERLAIMRDSRIGGYGALGLVIATGLKASALAAIVSGDGEGAGAESAWLALIGAAMAGRGALPALMHWLPAARANGLGAMAGRPSVERAAAAAAIGALALPLLLGPGAGIVAALVGALAAGGLALIARAKIGGQTGDVLGAAEQAVEIAVLLSAAALIVG